MLLAKLLPMVVAAGVVSAAPAGADFENLGREVLGPRDGWAAGTTGGSAATRDHVYFVDSRSELVAALAGNESKIIYVRGTIEGNADDNDRPLSCADYADPGYSLQAYLTQYDPATWGRVEPSGPLEDARARSQANQARRVVVPVSSNTTIVGLGDDATLHGLTLRASNVDNVIIRNLRFEDAYDCFPQWDPLDGDTGNWNSEYDNLVLAGATHVWVDRSEFSDGGNTTQPTYFGRKYEVHDGLLDVVNGADLVTLSYNHFHDHDKSLLIGNTDRPTYDVGKLRVTLHHNLFENLGSRAPRVRYGQLHVYNNLYVIPGEYEYSWGVGVESKIYAENNFFQTRQDPSLIAKWWKGTVLHATGTLVNGRPVDVVAAHNAAFDPDLGTDVGWTPTLVPRLDRTIDVPRQVRAKAGVGRNW
ncbi:polysaccharide lyase family 1 protein [Kibdelosporangium persicum]|uniref:Pectate lyase/Amb allergen n=1 Tax=Kibdelosporangium persicum TaxID=2698649 RepID=A0ABX2F7A8_9PSEU|nr:pectate lyase [Kibdelosporangium persicum]NRN67068.1 Pectate lyase/Amb allergen [Kibdelosporangium persicum]